MYEDDFPIQIKFDESANSSETEILHKEIYVTGLRESDKKVLNIWLKNCSQISTFEIPKEIDLDALPCSTPTSSRVLSGSDFLRLLEGGSRIYKTKKAMVVVENNSDEDADFTSSFTVQESFFERLGRKIKEKMFLVILCGAIFLLFMIGIIVACVYCRKSKNNKKSQVKEKVDNEKVQN